MLLPQLQIRCSFQPKSIDICLISPRKHLLWLLIRSASVIQIWTLQYRNSLTVVTENTEINARQNPAENDSTNSVNVVENDWKD